LGLALRLPRKIRRSAALILRWRTFRNMRSMGVSLRRAMYHPPNPNCMLHLMGRTHETCQTALLAPPIAVVKGAFTQVTRMSAVIAIFRQRSATTPLTVFKHHFLSNWRNSTGAPFSTIKATLTPGEGELGAISISFPAISAERSSTSKATCGTVRTSSGTGASGSNRIHSIP